MTKHGHGAAVSTVASHTHAVLEYSGIAGNITENHIKSPTNNNSGNLVGYSGEHSHTVTIYLTGDDKKHENRMPYEVVSYWKRTG